MVTSVTMMFMMIVLEFLRTSMVSGMVNAKERNCVLQRTKKYRLEGTNIL